MVVDRSGFTATLQMTVPTRAFLPRMSVSSPCVGSRTLGHEVHSKFGFKISYHHHFDQGTDMGQVFGHLCDIQRNHIHRYPANYGRLEIADADPGPVAGCPQLSVCVAHGHGCNPRGAAGRITGAIEGKWIAIGIVNGMNKRSYVLICLLFFCVSRLTRTSLHSCFS